MPARSSRLFFNRATSVRLDDGPDMPSRGTAEPSATREHRQPQIDVGKLDAAESARSHADDLVGLPLDSQRAADNAGAGRRTCRCQNACPSTTTREPVAGCASRSWMKRPRAGRGPSVFQKPAETITACAMRASEPVPTGELGARGTPRPPRVTPHGWRPAHRTGRTSRRIRSPAHRLCGNTWCSRKTRSGSATCGGGASRRLRMMLNMLVAAPTPMAIVTMATAAHAGDGASSGARSARPASSVSTRDSHPTSRT